VKPVASLSLDLDNQWSYLTTRGNDSWSRFPSYLDTVVPMALRMLQDAGVTITFFVAGQDAALDRNSAALRSLADSGHEIGNHSFSHEPRLHLCGDAQLAEEVERTEHAIETVCGVRTRGFRGPGCSVSEPMLDCLKRRGYAYDASTLPTFIGPLARAFSSRSAGLTPPEREQRERLFGSAGDGLWRIHPYRWDLADGPLVEVPITTFPGLRVPMHISYVLYLERVWPGAARAYFRAALGACRARGVGPSVLLHPLDLLGGDDVADSGLELLPGMSMTGARKRSLVRDCLRLMTERFDVGTVAAHAEALDRDGTLPLVAPRFRSVSRSVSPGRVPR
jgi:hypothetical protein